MKTACALCLLSTAMAAAQTLPLTLEQAASRRRTDFGPAYEGRVVRVKGQIALPPVRLHVSGYAHLGIQDAAHGLVLEGPLDRFDQLRPGEWIEVTGQIRNRAGLPVLLPEQIAVVKREPAPKPAPVKLEELLGYRLLGRAVAVELTVTQISENSGGVYLTGGPPEQPLKVFSPLPAPNVEWQFSGLKVGDRVQATGLASQYCPIPPYNKRFQLMIHSPADVVEIERGWLVPAWGAATLTAGILLTSLILWRREVRHRRQRETLRKVYELGEEIFGASGPAEILRSILDPLPRVFKITSVCLYIYNRNTKMLDPLTNSEEAAAPIPLEGVHKGIEAGAVSCFRNRALLSVQDRSRSPFAPEPGERKEPRSMLLIPMFAQGESMGVLQLGHDTAVRNFTPIEKLVAQHLGNQIGVAIKLLEQRSIREQLFRTEKVAAVGRLITGVVNELQAPLSTIASLSERALAANGDSGDMVTEIHSEARRASAIVNRLVSFDRPEQVDSRPLDLNRLLRSLMEFRELEWKARGIQVGNFLRDGPLFIVGSQGQLEQVFLSLLVYAEQALADAPSKAISIGSNQIARRVLVEISFTSGGQDGADPFAANSHGQSGTLDLSVCRSIVAGHEGEIRLTRARASESRFEIELPWSPADADVRVGRIRSARASSRQPTALLMESDEAVERQLLKLLGARAYRVVPVRSADEGLDLAQRLRFDVALCSSRLPGLNWIELLQRTREKVGGFVLMTDGGDPHWTAPAAEAGYFVLAKPVQENQLDYILDHLHDPDPVRVAG
jgi:signal transduction histidine kinase/CheY-like chemotaxis protein